jgi:lipopolysaccharide assembly outer membrane protein LptD (OstA)
LLKATLKILLFILISSTVYSQISETDSTKINISHKTVDSTRTNDSLKVKIDTSKQVQSDIDEIINYHSEDSVVFDIKEKKMYLYNNSELTYKDLKLNSGIIVFEQEAQTLDAIGLPDSLDKSKFMQLPLMYQGNEKYEGTMLTYNFQTQQGNISMGYSDADVGYYFGEKIKKVTSEVYFIKNGLYTTSTDKVEPEYYFFSPKMKIIPKDKIFAQSVFLYVEGVPIFWIPFAVLPNRHGRASGILMPTYGNDGTYGAYFANFGYFWATNDYMDFTFKGSAFTKGRFDLNARYRYTLKYKFSGTLEAGYSRIRTGEDKDLDKYSSDQWVLNLTHSHTINPTTSISGNLSFVSGKSYYDNSTNNLSTLLTQNAVSNLTLSKSWDDSPYSLSINYYRDQNLKNGDVSERLPSISFTRTESYPFRSNSSTQENLKFYEYFSYSYSGNFRNTNTRSTLTGYLGQDSVYNDSRLGAIHNINFNFSPKSDYINIKPYFYYTELWYGKYITKEINPSDNTVVEKDNNGFKAVRYFQTGVSFNTKLIGIVNPKVLNITGIRHTITPSITYQYMPDFSSDKWGYYGKYTDTTGTTHKYSHFYKEIFGGAPSGESQSLVFSIGNLFEMKTKSNDTTENKFQLINISLSSTYNFAADSLKWSELSSSFRTQVGNILNIGGGATFNFYEYDSSASARVNRYLLSTKGKLADLTSFNINLSTSYSFNLSNVKETPKPPAPKDRTDSLKQKKTEEMEKMEKEKKEVYDVTYNMPITGSLNYNYSFDKHTPSSIYKTSNISGNIAINPSDKWKFTFTTSYDFFSKQISAPYITIYRDLKSWEINFNWYPVGSYRGFFFELRIKAPSMNDIKIDKQTNSRGVY